MTGSATRTISSLTSRPAWIWLLKMLQKHCPCPPRRPKVTKDGVAIVSATIVGNDLTIALTKEAMSLDQTDIWVFAWDGSEYARKRIQVTIGTSTSPYVMTALVDMVLREDDATNTTIDLASGFMDPDVASRTGVRWMQRD